jgi:transketolase
VKKDLIKKIIKTCFINKKGHIASALSVLDFMYFLFFKTLTDNDHFVLSKGHASLALYAVFMEKGFITEEDFFSFCQENSILGGHPSSNKIKQVMLSTGSLGHGLPFCVGLALAKKIKKEPGNVFCLIGDGEANEGTIWESALIASTHNLNNLICIMDFNKSGERAIKLNSCVEKFKSFNWSSFLVENGHEEKEISKAINDALKDKPSNPKFIQLNTIKGYGCTPMENNPEWHHKQPQDEEQFKLLLDGIK